MFSNAQFPMLFLYNINTYYNGAILQWFNVQNNVVRGTRVLKSYQYIPFVQRSSQNIRDNDVKREAKQFV